MGRNWSAKEWVIITMEKTNAFTFFFYLKQISTKL